MVDKHLTRNNRINLTENLDQVGKISYKETIFDFS